jgi:hypothetical protein
MNRMPEGDGDHPGAGGVHGARCMPMLVVEVADERGITVMEAAENLAGRGWSDC